MNKPRTSGNVPQAAIVTGASGGLGRAFAVELARIGSPVVVVARREAELNETARLVRAEGVPCVVVVGDVCDPGLAEKTVAVAESQLGAVDLLVNNAGVMFIGSVEDSDPAEWWNCVTINVFGPLLWARAVMASMAARRHGWIINISSPGAFTEHA
jgi:3-oxoacyl-[acyl-carrier protein] reductase